MLLLFVCLLAIIGRLRTSLLFLLTLSIPITFRYNLTYVPQHIGASAGLTVEVVDLSLFILLAMWLYENRFGRRGQARFFPATTLPFLSIFACGFLSLFNTNFPDLTAYGLVDILRCLLLYICLANNTLDPGDRRTAFLGLQAGVILLSLVCILESLRGVNLLMGTYQVAEKQEWESVFRSAGLSTPTLTAGYIASVLPLFLSQVFTSGKIGGRLFLIATIFMGIIGLLLTLTRTAFLSLAVGAVIVLIHLLRKRRVNLIHLVLLIGVSISLFLGYSENIKTRLDEGMDNVIARYALALTALNAIRENPILGIGLNTYHQEMDKYGSNIPQEDFEFVVHNKFLLTWAEMGPFALISLSFLILVLLRKTMIIARSRDKEAGITSAGLLASLIVTIIHMNLESYAGGFMMCLFSTQVALIASLSLQNKRSEQS